MNYKFLVAIIILITFVACSYDIDDKLKNQNSFNIEEIIPVDSDLFNQIKDITKSGESVHVTIACIDFLYPLTLFVFDQNLEYVTTAPINNDLEFSEFLEGLDITYSISMSFPISSILSSGEEFIINNKEELKEAIDSCLNEELLLECEEQIRDCIWKIGYDFGGENEYLGGIFQQTNGLTTLNVHDSLFIGSWTPFVIENELHLNISLNNSTQVEAFFNKDWKAEFLDENTLQLTYESHTLILNQRCDSTFNSCGDFNFETCATEINSDFAEFILEDYSFCIFDTLELSNEFEISYHKTEEDALSFSNPIISTQPYINTENHQMIYVRINDMENDIQYYVVITLNVSNC